MWKLKGTVKTIDVVDGRAKYKETLRKKGIQGICKEQKQKNKDKLLSIK